MADRFMDATGFRKLIRKVDTVYDKQQTEQSNLMHLLKISHTDYNRYMNVNDKEK